MGQRLGIAAALLGDPEVLLFDEPVNGLDPDGIRWVRTFLRSLAKEGRTVLVSSHLMREMALTADDVIIIGKGRLILQTSVEDLLAHSSRRFVRVVSPDVTPLRLALEAEGATTSIEDDGSLTVRGKDQKEVGELAARLSVVLYELTPQTESLEEAFMDLTENSIEYRGTGSASAASTHQTTTTKEALQ
jgi:ABC-2 type transport system ATP-binding protein